MRNKYLVSVVGPTAIGKTSLSITLAEAFQTEILSADSRQFYREMSIGTAAPNKDELQAVPHHFIQHISITENYSVGDFEKDALNLVEKLFVDKNILILVGGSGLYVKSLLEGLDEFPETDPEIRLKLNRQLENEGLQSLSDRLKKLDPGHYDRIDRENPHRVIRALEVCIGTGKPYSSFLKNNKKDRSFESIKIGLTAPRQEIYNRINRRVEMMMEEGLMEEVKSLYSQKQLNALNTVGYKELFAHLEGKHSLKEAVEEIKKNTRRFAKRQLTWFRKEEDIHWFDHTTPASEIIAYVKAEIQKKETLSKRDS